MLEKTTPQGIFGQNTNNSGFSWLPNAYKKVFLCALRAEDVHCVGIKFLEFISLLSVSIQYLQVGELLLCSGGFCNLYFLLSIAIILLFCSLTATIPAIPAAIHSPAMPPVLTAMRNGMTVESARNRS